MRARFGWALVLAAFSAPAAAHVDEKIFLTLDDGHRLEATLRLPDGAAPKLPAIMLFGGFRNAATVLDRVRFARPVIWASFDYPFEPPRKFALPGSLRLAPQMRSAIHRTLDGVGKLHAALAAHPRVDAARITVAGGSAGAPFAVIGAARHAIPGVVLVQGFAEPRRVVQHLLARKHRERWGFLADGLAGALAAWMIWYCQVPDIAAHARALGAAQKVLMVTASEDDYVPRPASAALGAALSRSAAQVEALELPGRHLRIKSVDEIAAILERSQEWLSRVGLL